MIQTPTVEELTQAATRNLRSQATRVVGTDAAERPRFELYHAAPSLCSHKVRMVLAEKHQPYTSHDLNLIPGRRSFPDCYQPSYVKLRLRGAPEGSVFARGYTGQSSVETEGFDPCVVPTLIDHEEERVVVDSRTICQYIEEHAPGPSLVPAVLREQVGAQVESVDRAPHVAVFYGAHPDLDPRPKLFAGGIRGSHDRKIHALERLLSQSEDDALRHAYACKIEKESGGRGFVASADDMRAAHAAMAGHVMSLEEQLSTHPETWVLGSDFTLADVLWTTSLYRLQWLGLGNLWAEGAPRVKEYTRSAFARESFAQAVLDWPFAYAPSPHVPSGSGVAQTVRFLWHVFRQGA